MPQRIFNLKTTDYEHPFDREALKKAKSIPGFDKVVNFVMQWAVIKWNIIALKGTNFHVTRDACEKLYTLAQTVTDTLDIHKMPDVYIGQDYYINAYTTGHDKDAYIVLTTGAVDKLTDEELGFVIGHEAGHIKSSHVLYHLMTAFISQIIGALAKIPGIGSLVLPLQYWSRMSEFTADRAGLLACQDLNVALSAIMKMSGLPERYFQDASIDGFIKQARDFEENNGGADAVIKGISIIDEDHPWTVARAAELIKWYESGEYTSIISRGLGKKCGSPMCGRIVPTDAVICPYCGYNFTK